MDTSRVQTANRKNMEDIPDESQIDFEEMYNKNSEELKKLGRQVED
ncbi:hypothetical protein [Sinanaerobacter chloroacetimidivorans]|uniref:Uncharacterized protein n=1 Tax=Sinanaerobacter chloroacetimidivorans TaxID=2818044 RepID=A0A8J7W545_9FIRM|nr:hypothetical protein [Sinanaerobacter chloroacetimidivorans]MBR0599206.1 hypothetical protein [Sinanaerobacter chloroacetimidivorans]